MRCALDPQPETPLSTSRRLARMMAGLTFAGDARLACNGLRGRRLLLKRSNPGNELIEAGCDIIGGAVGIGEIAIDHPGCRITLELQAEEVCA